MQLHALSIKPLRALSLCLLCAFAFAAAQAATAHAAPPCKRSCGDTTAPATSWKTPAASATVSGLLWESTNSGPSGACEATATDNVGVTKVAFHVDAQALNVETIAPWNCKLDTTTLSDGSHTLKAVSYDAAGNSSTSLRTITVKNTPDPGDTTAPSVSWTSPSASATVSGLLWEPANSGPSGPCEAAAADNVAVARVVFSVDSTALNTEDVAPYNCRLDTTTLSDGSHTLKAVAYDGVGNASTATRTVVVDNVPDADTTPPSVAWTSPSDNAVVAGVMGDAASATVCAATATDAVGVAKVAFSVDGTALNEDASAPYNCHFDTTTVADGSYVLRAVAHDAAGNTASATRTVIVDNVPTPPPGDTTAPSVSWTKPAASATVSGYMFEAANSGASGPCEAASTDNVGVTKVMFYVDGALLNQEGMAPYNCKFDTTLVADGSHTLKAVSYDAAGNTATATRTVTVDNGAAPPPPPSGGTVVFEDNFDGTTLNTSNWTPYNGPGHGGNGLRRPSAFSVSGGNVVITATWDGTNIVSGGMAHKTNYTYGTFEARVRTEADTTAQTSGIVMTWPQNDVWPRNGENDFYETGGSTSSLRNPFYSYIHHQNATSGGQQTKITHFANATDWHVMRMEWTPASIKVYRDGVFIGQESRPELIPATGHHYSIQLDALANNPLPGPVRMYVDWVKVYK